MYHYYNLAPRACDPREGTRGSGIIRCRKPIILAKIELRIPFQRPIRFLPETDYPRALRSFPRIAGSGNEIVTIKDHAQTQGLSEKFGSPGQIFLPGALFFPEKVGEQGGGGGGDFFGH